MSSNFIRVRDSSEEGSPTDELQNDSSEERFDVDKLESDNNNYVYDQQIHRQLLNSTSTSMDFDSDGKDCDGSNSNCGDSYNSDLNYSESHYNGMDNGEDSNDSFHTAPNLPAQLPESILTIAEMEQKSIESSQSYAAIVRRIEHLSREHTQVIQEDLGGVSQEAGQHASSVDQDDSQMNQEITLYELFSCF